MALFWRIIVSKIFLFFDSHYLSSKLIKLFDNPWKSISFNTFPREISIFSKIWAILHGQIALYLAHLANVALLFHNTFPEHSTSQWFSHSTHFMSIMILGFLRYAKKLLNEIFFSDFLVIWNNSSNFAKFATREQ